MQPSICQIIKLSDALSLHPFVIEIKRKLQTSGHIYTNIIVFIKKYYFSNYVK